MWPINRLRSLINNLGVAWWAEVKTAMPNVTYWFGPFVSKRSLSKNLPIFLEDLSEEGYESIDERIVRCQRNEPFTL